MDIIYVHTQACVQIITTCAVYIRIRANMLWSHKITLWYTEVQSMTVSQTRVVG